MILSRPIASNVSDPSDNPLMLLTVARSSSLNCPHMMEYIFFSWSCSYLSSFTYILIRSFHIYLSVSVTGASVLSSVIWGIGVLGMLSTGIFSVSVDFLTLELKFGPAYSEISLSVFRYWPACPNEVLSNMCPRMALVLPANFSVVFLNRWFQFRLSPLPVSPSYIRLDIDGPGFRPF